MKHAFSVTALFGLIALTGICCRKQAESPREPAIALSAVTQRESAPFASSSSTQTLAAGALFEGYAIGQPDEQQELPHILNEISGLTDISDHEVACVQDEAGTVFIYDLTQRLITRRIPFAESGDFEGLTRVDKTLYVLRSDGTIFQIDDFASANPKSHATALKLPASDNESLCYDPIGARLLIAPKSRLGKGEEEKRTRALFQYDPVARQIAPEPVVLLDLDGVSDGRVQKSEPKRGKKRVMPSRFLLSSVSVHPKTGDYFVLSATAHNLAVFDRQGKLKTQAPLDPTLLPQPEGLTFLPNDSLVLTSEGAVGKSAVLMRFSRR